MALQKRTISITDEITGEIFDGIPVLFPGKKQFCYQSFIVMSQLGIVSKIIDDYSFSGTDFRVLFFFIESANFENLVSFKMNELEKRLGSSRTNILKSIKRLIEKEIVLKINKYHNYKINPQFCWKGDNSKLAK